MSDRFAPGTAETRELYAWVQQFYVRQLTSLDDGRADDWAAVFAEDAVFEEIHRGAPLRGRTAIRDRARVAALAVQRLHFRHWLSMLRVEVTGTDAAGTATRLRVRMYAMAMATPHGSRLELKASVVCHDLIERHGARWLVRHRDLRHDGTGRTATATRKT